MRVGISAEFLGVKRGGTTTYTQTLLLGLAEQHQHHFFPYLATAAAFDLVPSAPNLEPRLVAPYSAAIRLTTTLPIELLSRPVDLLHAQGWAPPWTPCPVVLTVHDLSWETEPTVYPALLRWRLRWLVWANVRRARRIIASSHQTALDLQGFYGCPAEKIRVIPCAVDPAWQPVDDPARRAAAQRRYGINGPYLLYVGGIEPRKGVDRLIRAYAALRRRHDQLPQLVIAGTPQRRSESILALPAALGIEHEVIFTGPVATDDLAPLYSGAELFAFLGLYEGFGLPPIEAMACGTPVVAADRAALPEVVGEAGLLVDPGDEGAIVTALERLLAEPALRSQLRQAGRRRAQQFQPGPLAQRVVAVYEESLVTEQRQAARV